MDTLCTEKLMSFENYLNYTGNVEERYELHNGVLITMSPPTLKHILIAKMLEFLFDQEVKRQSLPLDCLREVGVRTGYRKVRLLVY
jgi:Uma2 family endonuclease